MRIIRIILTIKNKPDDVNYCELFVLEMFVFFPVVICQKKVINRSLNGVSNTRGKPINITVIEPTMMSVNQCAPIIYSGKRKNHKNNKGR